MTQIFHLPEDIRQEFSIDQNGQAYASQSAIARLCRVTQQAINKLLLQLKGTTKPVSESLEPFTGKDYMATTKIPDIVVAAIINHYAMYARKTTEEAKKVSLCFQAIGIRTWIQAELGWQQTNPPSSLTPEKMFLFADYAADCAQQAGISQPLIQTIKLDTIMQAAPESKPFLLPQKQAIVSAHPLTEPAVSPTIIGQRLAQKLGLEKISPHAINKKLLTLGYQTSVTRIKKSTGKETHDYYQPTEKTLNGNHGQLEMTSYQDSTGKNTKYQLRWFNSIIDILAQNWQVPPLPPQKKLARSLAPSKGAGSLVKTQSPKPSRKQKQDQVKQAILANLTDEHGNPLSNREIARRCGVSHPFVSNIRKKLFPPQS